MKLFNYFRSSASFRVRIALQLKGLGYDYIPVHLVRGEHHDPAYTGRVGDALVPTLLTDDGVALSQSMAIIEYLDETHPSPPLLPAEPLARAHVRALAQMVACEMHPPNNLRVLNYLVQKLRWTKPARTPGTATGPAAGWRPSSASWCCWRSSAQRRAWHRPCLAGALPPRWPTAAWCRMCSIASVSTSLCKACR